MERITRKHLEARIKNLNEVTGSPTEAYIKNDETGKWEPQAHSWVLDGAYGGFELQRMCATGTGTHAPLNTGHIPARELAGLIKALLIGFELGRTKHDEGCAVVQDMYSDMQRQFVKRSRELISEDAEGSRRERDDLWKFVSKIVNTDY